MKKLFLTPGPSQLFHTIPFHIKTALHENILSISHRGEQFKQIFNYTTDSLRRLLKIPNDYSVFFVSSGTEAMERIVENTVEKKSFHFVNGSFSQRWYEIAEELGKNAQKVEAEFGKGFHTLPTISQNTELICFTHNETSSGVAIDPQFIYNVARQNPQALIAVDTVSSAPYVDLDYTKLDCVFFSVQKLFGLPAGLSIIILSPRALKKSRYLQKKKVVIGTYHNFPTLVDFAEKYQTPETPNVLGIYLLGKVSNDYLTIGIEKIRSQITEKAAYLYSFFDAHHLYKPFVKDLKDRSQTIITIDVNKDGEKIKKMLLKKGISIGNGYGPLKDSQVRITNFPAMSKKDIEKLLWYI